MNVPNSNNSLAIHNDNAAGPQSHYTSIGHSNNENQLLSKNVKSTSRAGNNTSHD